MFGSKKKESEQFSDCTLMEDYAFKMVFKTEKATKTYLLDLVNSILRNFDAPLVRSLKLRPAEILPFFNEHKDSQLDLLAEDENGRLFDLEIQTYPQAIFCDRLLYYLSKLLARQLKRGQGYENLRPVVGVALIADEAWNVIMKEIAERFALERREEYKARYYDSFLMSSPETGAIYSSLLTVYLIRVPSGEASLTESAKRFKDAETPIWLKVLASNIEFIRDELRIWERQIPSFRILRKEMELFFGLGRTLAEMRERRIWKRNFIEDMRSEQRIFERRTIQEAEQRIKQEVEQKDAEIEQKEAEIERLTALLKMEREARERAEASK